MKDKIEKVLIKLRNQAYNKGVFEHLEDNPEPVYITPYLERIMKIIKEAK